jgi:DNA-binding FrmR family transcriptional regulator
MIHSNPQSYKTLTTNLKQAQGTLKKIETMLEADEYCGDIAQQINASIWLLKKMNATLLRSHLLCCGKNKLQSKDDNEVKEFLDEFFRLVDVWSKK